MSAHETAMCAAVAEITRSTLAAANDLRAINDDLDRDRMQFSEGAAQTFGPEAAATMLRRFFEGNHPSEVRMTDSSGRDWQISEMWPEGDTLRISLKAVPNFDAGDR